MILLWISVALCAFTIAFFFYKFAQFKKARDLLTFNKRFLLVFIECLALFTAFSVGAAFGIKMWNNYPMSGGHIAMLFFGALLFGVSFMALLEAFTIYFYKSNFDEKLKKILKIIMIASIPIAIISLFITLDAYAFYIPQESFPFYSGISFNGGIHLMTRGAVDGFTINWYGIIILAGAIIAYFTCDHHFYQEYKRHGLIDTLFILVFLFGIFGARVWYCTVLEPGTPIFANTGGLAIMGGVIFGAPVGILFLILFRRYINLRHAIDLILPCVLIAQAIGRWGNFCNQEVYGYMTFDPATVWWLPQFIVKQMTIDGVMHLPLFYIECITNLTGYFVIVYGVGKGLKKHISNGDLFCLYIVWYGLTRIVLEPLRASGFEYNNSIITAWVMFGGGLGGIVGLHLYDYFGWAKRTFFVKDNMFRKKKPEVANNPRNPYYVKPIEIKQETIVNDEKR
ncbi:MAG: prolipoprotein diacylglyceryl transferase [Bacilli bacterium]|nr:prolipoprotein diacylglyceryl transferase [Bacilli bacterium]